MPDSNRPCSSSLPSTHPAASGKLPARCLRHPLILLGAGAAVLLGLWFPRAARGGLAETTVYKVSAPIVRGNLTVYPVIAQSFDTSRLLTLDEGVRAGQVVVSEASDQRPLIRPGQPIPPLHGGAEVNRLVLYNNSDKPLLLLAGEIVTGGKQDRVIGSDRIVPAQTGPIDLGVFCVEPGRWVGASDKFGSMGGQMAQPAVRAPAMAEKNQSLVWDSVRAVQAKVAAGAPAADAAEVKSSTSYAKAFSTPAVAKMVAGYGGVENETAILRELRAKGAVGVVVAVGNRVLWADVFASTDLLTKYWPKLVRSYIAEAMTSAPSPVAPSPGEAQRFIDALSGNREVVETESGVYRRTDTTGEGYRVFELTSLLPRTGFVVHITKLPE